MTYTPPAGNALELFFTGEAYSSPEGNAVAFSFRVDVEGVGVASIVPDVSATAFVAVGGAASVALLTSYGTDIPRAEGTGRVVLSVVANATGEDIDPLGVGIGAIIPAATASGTGYILGSGARSIPLAAYAPGSAAAGVGVANILPGGFAESTSYPIAVASARDFLAVWAIGSVGRSGVASAQIRLQGAASAGATSGTALAQRWLSATGSAYVGRSGMARGALRLAAACVGAHGIAGSASANVLSGAAYGHFIAGVSGEANANLLVALGSGNHQDGRKPVSALYIRTTRESVVVH